MPTHKLIRGGEQYLPFAESKIRALRAAGLRHVTQRTVFPDAEVMVRLVGDIDYIEINGQDCTLGMDSGVVDVLTIAPAHPSRFLPGKLYETQDVAAYQAAFVPQVPPTGWRLNPADSNAGQIAGLLRFRNRSAFRGRVPEDQQPARSFSPRRIEDTSTTPPSVIVDPADELLYLKKLAAALCPASIFTGRTRLYVQAMYGQHLYRSARGSTTPGANDKPTAVPGLAIGGSATPALVLQPTPTDTEAGSPVTLTTSSGVYLDAETGKHWLFVIGIGTVTVYPLVGSTCAESMRKHLITINSPVPQPLGDEDRAHLEAFILSTCLPSVQRKAVLTIPAVEAFAMGYGWHWNRTGLAADIVINAVFEQGGISRAMRSTHRRVTMTRRIDTEGVVTFEAALAVVEGPKDWAVHRALWTIAEPSWASLTLLKTTPRQSDLIECDAPFYAFYRGDDLQVCRVKVRFISGSEPKRTISTRFADSEVYGANDIGYSTVGLLDGFLEERLNGVGYVEAEFRCGGEVLAGLTYGKTNSGQRIDLKNKVHTGFIGPTVSDGSYQVNTYDTGYPNENDIWEQAGPYEGFPNNSITATVEYDIRTVIVQESETSQATIVVPINDAEAVYLQGSINSERHEFGNTVHFNAGFAGVEYIRRARIWYPYSGDGGTYTYVDRYGYNNGGAASGADEISTTPVDETIATNPLNREALVCSAGTLPATFTQLGQFHANELEEVSAQFATLSTPRGSVVLAPGHVEPVGLVTPLSETAVPVLVGWA